MKKRRDVKKLNLHIKFDMQMRVKTLICLMFVLMVSCSSGDTHLTDYYSGLEMSENYEIFFGNLSTRYFPIKPIAPAITKLAGASKI